MPELDPKPPPATDPKPDEPKRKDPPPREPGRKEPPSTPAPVADPRVR
jgi:hypothetical protein